MSDCSIGVHIWKWAAHPDCKIPDGMLCDCGAIKWGERTKMKSKINEPEPPTEYPWYG